MEMTPPFEDSQDEAFLTESRRARIAELSEAARDRYADLLTRLAE
jgi:hypothetical protein